MDISGIQTIWSMGNSDMKIDKEKWKKMLDAEAKCDSVMCGDYTEGKFPKLDGGWCDGMGCGWGSLCYCSQWLESREQYQREYNLPWDGNESSCKIWERSFRHNYGVNSIIYKKQCDDQRTEDRYASGIIGDRNETISILCDLVEQMEDDIDDFKRMAGIEHINACVAEIKLEEAEETIDELRENKITSGTR